MLFKAMPAEVMAAWSHAAIPDMDFQELSLTGAGPTWSIPREGDAQPAVRNAPRFAHVANRRRDRRLRTRRAGARARPRARVRYAMAAALTPVWSLACALTSLVFCLQVDHDGVQKANQQRSEVRHSGAGSRE
jgi:hypothetical protein